MNHIYVVLWYLKQEVFDKVQTQSVFRLFDSFSRYNYFYPDPQNDLSRKASFLRRKHRQHQLSLSLSFTDNYKDRNCHFVDCD